MPLMGAAKHQPEGRNALAISANVNCAGKELQASLWPTGKPSLLLFAVFNAGFCFSQEKVGVSITPFACSFPGGLQCHPTHSHFP